MTRCILSSCLGLALSLCLVVGQAHAQNDGQADLDKATQLKIDATSTAELSDVILLCEKAIQKGLDANNAPFAKDLLASTLVQRGSMYATKTFRSILADGNWQADRKAALVDLEKGIELSVKQPQALYMIARLNFLPGGDAKRAADALDQTISLSDAELPLRAEALALRSRMRKDSAQRLADLDEAVRAAQATPPSSDTAPETRAELGNIEAALDDVNKAIALEPKQIAAYQLKAMILVKKKKVSEALAVLEKAAAVAPDNVDVPLTRARLYTLDANYKAALSELNRATTLDPANLAVLVLRAAVYHEMGEKKKALADVDKILAVKPHLPSVMRDRAVLLADLGKIEEAVAQLERLHEAEPKDALTLMQLGMLYTAMKQSEKAVKSFGKVLAEHPDEWTAYRGRGDAQLNLGHREQAIRDYDSGLRLQPKDVGILNNLAWVLATAPEDKLRDGKRAVTLATEACKITEYKQDYILSTLAAAYAESGDFLTARKWSAKAIELGTKQHLANLKKELESYTAGKPWRDFQPLDEEEKDRPKENKAEPKNANVKAKAEKKQSATH